MSERDVRRAIERLKQDNLSGHSQNINPDVVVDFCTGEVYPEMSRGRPSSESIGNILDYL